MSKVPVKDPKSEPKKRMTLVVLVYQVVALDSEFLTDARPHTKVPNIWSMKVALRCGG